MNLFNVEVVNLIKKINRELELNALMDSGCKTMEIVEICIAGAKLKDKDQEIIRERFASQGWAMNLTCIF